MVRWGFGVMTAEEQEESTGVSENERVEDSLDQAYPPTRASRQDVAVRAQQRRHAGASLLEEEDI